MDSDIFGISDLSRELSNHPIEYLEFLNTPALRTGLYELAAGATDTQEPHLEDEVYYVIRGLAKFDCEGKLKPVAPGEVVYVRAGVAHRFVDIEEDLHLLVFFSSIGSKS